MSFFRHSERTPAGEPLRLVSEIAHAVTHIENKDLPQVVSRILEAVRVVSGLRRGQITLLDHAFNEVYVLDDDPQATPVRSPVSEVAQAPDFHVPVPSAEGGGIALVPVRAKDDFLLEVPVAAGSRELGLLYILSRNRRLELSAESRQTLETLASLAAIAIDRRRQRRDSSRLREWLDALWGLFTANRIPRTQEDIDRLLGVIADKALRISDADFVVLYEYMHESKGAHPPPVLAGEVRDRKRLVDGPRGDGNPALLRLLQLREPVFAAGAGSGEPSPFPGEGVVSSVGMPLRVDEEVVGVLFLNFRSEQNFNQELREHLGLFANQAALAIGNARLFLRSQALDQELSLRGRTQLLVRVLREISGCDDLDKMVELIVFHAVDLLYADAGALFLRVNEAAFELRSSTEGETERLQALRSGEARSWLAQVAAEEPREIMALPRQDSPADLRLLADSLSSVLVPVRTDDRLLGLLLIESRQRNHFNADQELLTILASQAAVSINRVQLLRYREETRQGLQVSANAVAVGQIATSFVHEAKNSLNGMSLTVHNLREDIDSEPDLKAKQDYSERLSLVLSEMERLDELYRRLQRFTKQGLRPEKKEIYLNDIVASTLQLLESVLRGKEMRFESRLDPSLGRPAAGKGNPVEVDEGQVQQVLINLILNAVAASARRGRIFVETRSHSNQVEIRVSDYGSGITGEAKRNLFSPFFTTKRDGVGLGLFISRLLVEENHAGSIEILNTAPNKGTTFSVRLPRRT